MNKDIKLYIEEFENKKALDVFFKLLNEMISILQIGPENEKLSLNYRSDKKSIHATLNSRLVLGINKKADFSFMINVSDYQYLSEKITFFKQEEFIKLSPKAYLLYSDYNQFSDNLELIKPLWLKSCIEYEPAQEKSQYRINHINELYQMAMGETNNKAIKNLISEYKEHIRQNGIDNEIYKWKLVNKLKGQPDVNAEDFEKSIELIFPSNNNMAYKLAGATSIRMAKLNSENYKLCLLNLFNEDKPLEVRVKNFLAESKEIYEATEGKNSSHHDERTLSVYLTFKYPEKYIFYKSEYYEKYCRYLDIKSKEPGQKFAHYLELIKDLSENYIQKDVELLQFVDSRLNTDDCYPDKNRFILAQDILYQMFDRNFITNYWVFQANPKYYDIENALKAGVAKTWRVNQNKKGIKKGDKAILWVTGDKAGVYALVTINSDVLKITDTREELEFYVDKSEVNEVADGVELKLDYNLVNNPILKTQILSHPILNNLTKGVQGTNLKASKSQYDAILEMIKANNESEITDIKTNTMKPTLNQILYGPPGTGKTYNSINKAIEIIEPDFDLNQPREKIKEKYNELVKAGQIVFTTFHQSMSYEDFIEGIKPVPNNEQLFYNIESGIFLRICQSAQTPNIIEFNDAFSKLQNDLSEIERLKLYTPNGKEYEISLNSNGNLSLFTGAKKEQQGTLTKENIQKYINGEIVLGYWGGYFFGVKKYLEKKHGYSKQSIHPGKNYVLIIDEINRGNISQIFGELITLIEDDKRLGKPEALEVVLPYSKESFSVPANLYIIGTMNTADRSVEALDAAIRRRFSFTEMKPEPELIITKGKAQNGKIGDIDLVEVLKVINKRIEILLDKDHQIGHSYFLSTGTEEELKSVFKNKIIPLLQEYFFGDYGKIGLVLGSGFVMMEKNKSGSKIFADFDQEYEAADLAERPVYKIINPNVNDFDLHQALKTLLNN